MIANHNAIKIFCGNSNPALARDIAAHFALPLGLAEITQFSDGETSIQIKETVRGFDVFIVQSTCKPVNDNLMEMLIMIDAMRRASAGRITAVIPYYGYARQDRKVHPRDPISAKLVADLITSAGADRVLTMDLHAAQIQGYFNIPVDHLMGSPLLAAHFLERKFQGEDLVIVSPDHSSAVRARRFALRFNASIAIIDKHRPRANVSEVMAIIGEIKGKRCLMIDDMIDTAGTIVLGAQALMDHGAAEVYACCTHGVFSGPAIERIQNSPIKELIATDTIPLPQGVVFPKLRQLAVAPIFARAIERIYEEQPMSDLSDY